MQKFFIYSNSSNYDLDMADEIKAYMLYPMEGLPLTQDGREHCNEY
jgi:hypothetical protein